VNQFASHRAHPQIRKSSEEGYLDAQGITTQRSNGIDKKFIWPGCRNDYKCISPLLRHYNCGATLCQKTTP